MLAAFHLAGLEAWDVNMYAQRQADLFVTPSTPNPTTADLFS